MLMCIINYHIPSVCQKSSDALSLVQIELIKSEVIKVWSYWLIIYSGPLY